MLEEATTPTAEAMIARETQDERERPGLVALYVRRQAGGRATRILLSEDEARALADDLVGALGFYAHRRGAGA